jgi:hypothetical protein
MIGFAVLRRTLWIRRSICREISFRHGPDSGYWGIKIGGGKSLQQLVADVSPFALF